MSGVVNIGDVVFSRKVNVDQKEIDEIWDDTALIRAYDKAVNLAYDAAHASLKSKGDFQAASDALHFKKPTADHLDVKNTAGGAKHRRHKNKSKAKWKVGDRCLAKYVGDESWYEAIVLKIDTSKHRCIVKFDGYESEQEQSLGSLHRIPESGLEEDNESDCKSINTDDNESASELHSSTANELYKSCCSSTENLAHMETATKVKKPRGKAYKAVPFLPPPLPPAILNLRNKNPPSENEALSSMLMSWYMNGYHTGYYQAIRDMKQGSSSTLKDDKVI